MVRLGADGLRRRLRARRRNRLVLELVGVDVATEVHEDRVILAGAHGVAKLLLGETRLLREAIEGFEDAHVLIQRVFDLERPSSKREAVGSYLKLPLSERVEDGLGPRLDLGRRPRPAARGFVSGLHENCSAPRDPTPLVDAPPLADLLKAKP